MVLTTEPTTNPRTPDNWVSTALIDIRKNVRYGNRRTRHPSDRNPENSRTIHNVTEYRLRGICNPSESTIAEPQTPEQAILRSQLSKRRQAYVVIFLVNNQTSPTYFTNLGQLQKEKDNCECRCHESNMGPLGAEVTGDPLVTTTRSTNHYTTPTA